GREGRGRHDVPDGGAPLRALTRRRAPERRHVGGRTDTPTPGYSHPVESRSTAPHRPRTRRVLLPALLLLAWVALAGVGGGAIGALSGLQQNNSAAWLPESAESAHVLRSITEMRGSDTASLAVVAVREEGVTPQDRAFLAGVLDSEAGTGTFGDDVLGPLPSDDGKALVGGLGVVPDDRLADEITTLRADLERDAPAGLSLHVGGEAGVGADFTDAIAGIGGMLLVVAGAVVLVILVIVYRSPLLPLVVLLSAVGALAGSSLVVYALVDNGVLSIDAQSQGIM